MKRLFAFIGKAALAFAGAVVLFFAASSFVWVGLPSYYAGNYQKGLVKQYRALQNSDPDTPKILVLGDSCMAFSVDSAQLSALTGMPCYTLGMQGGMGKEYIFELAKPYINEGDIVVNPFTGYSSFWYGADLILLSLENEPDLYFDFLLRHPLSALSRLKDRCAKKVTEFLKGNMTEPEGNDFYKADAFDETGNMTYFRPRGRYTQSLEASDPRSFWVGMYSDLDISRVNAFTRFCEKRGATFLLTSAAVYDAKVTNTEEELAAFEAWFRSVFDAPLICEKWSDGFYAKGYMYDTAIHMNSYGMELYTQNLYEDLLPYLGQA